MKFIEYLFVKLLHVFFQFVPVNFNQGIAQFLSFLMRKIFRYRTNVVRDNLTLSFPDLSIAQMERIIREVYSNFACLLSELIQNHRLTTDYIEKHIRVHNFEIVEEAQRAGKGLILLSGHIGNFEWLGYYMAKRLNGLYAVMKPVRNEKVNSYIVKLRRRHNVKLIFTKGAIKKCLSALRDQQNIALAVDQDAGHKGIFVEFFNRPASTATGTAQFHLQTGAPMIFCVAIRKKWGDFDLFFERIPDMISHGDHKQNIFSITQVHTRLLEKWTRKHPGQYFWTHKRWNTVPNAEESEQYQHNLSLFKNSNPGS